MFPPLLPEGSCATIVVRVALFTVAEIPPIVTVEAELTTKFVPLIVTFVPDVPEATKTLLIVGTPPMTIVPVAVAVSQPDVI